MNTLSSIGKKESRRLGRAGLADALVIQDQCPHIPSKYVAELLGLEYREIKFSEDHSERTQDDDQGLKPLPEDGHVSLDLACFWRVRERIKFERDTIEISQRKPPKGTQLPYLERTAPPDWVPLRHWNSLWPFLKGVLQSTTLSRQIDESKTVNHLALQKPIDALPMKPLFSWAQSAFIVFDISLRLNPFIYDANVLIDNVTLAMGKTALRVVKVKGDPFESVKDPALNSNLHFPSQCCGEPVLILSDLGLYAGQQERDAWLSFGHHLKCQGFKPVVLSPTAPDMWDDDICKFFRMASWDKGSVLPCIHGPHGKGSSQGPPKDRTGQVEELLALLSPSIRVEPRLLRAMRTTLVPGADVGVEGLVWNHESVGRHHVAFYWNSDAHTELSEKFAKMPAEMQQAAEKVIGDGHSYLPGKIRLEERLNLYHALSKRLSPELEQYLDWLEGCLANKGAQTEEYEEELALWVLRMASRQLNETMESKKYSAIRNAHARAVLRMRDTNRNVLLPGWCKDSDFDEVKGSNDPPEDKTWELRQIGGRLQIINSGASEKGCRITKMRAGISLKVTMGGQEDKLTLFNELSFLLRDLDELVLRTDYEQLVLDCLVRPDWAESISRDKQQINPAYEEDVEVLRTGLLATLPLNDSTIMWAFPRDVASDKNSMLFPSLNDDGKEQGQWINLTQLDSITAKGIPDLSWATSHGFDQYGLYADIVIAGVTQRMRYILPGSFLMGSPEDEPERYDNEHQHEVTLTKGYWLADTTCTQELWTAVMGGNPSDFKGEKDLPVENVSWEDCVRFVDAVNKKHPGLGLRLPTEAQWEYACRAGTDTPFSFGKTITTDQVNYNGKDPYTNSPKGEYREKTVPVKELPSNQWGLHQMHGNVDEWCADWFGQYPEDTVSDPVGPAGGEDRVLRGGGWFIIGGGVRSACRDGIGPEDRYDGAGFRFSRGL